MPQLTRTEDPLASTHEACRQAAQLRLIGEGGFPHSEIVGSKVAHTSPTLIAACHVLHRLYMPRHPRIALTSRLRVHTTNNNTGSGQRPDTKLGRAVSRGKLGVDDNRSACCLRCHQSGQTWRRSSVRHQLPTLRRATNAVTASIKKPIHNVKQHAAPWGRVPLR